MSILASTTVLHKIRLYYNETGFYPTYEVLKELTGAKSKSTIHRKLVDLEESGFIVFNESRKAYKLK
jgi:SOS-response transcriptional repressor LexA